MSDELSRNEVDAYAIGYYHGRIGDLPFTLHGQDTAVFAAYTKGFDAGMKAYDEEHQPVPVSDKQERLEADGWQFGDAEDFLNDSDEDFPEHEGLDNQDYARAADMFVDIPDEVILDEDEVVARVAEKWKLNDFQWDDDSSPIVAIQIKDGGVWEAFATAPVRLYIMDEDTPDAEVPEGLTLDEQGTLTYASKWARGNVQFEN